MPSLSASEHAGCVAALLMHLNAIVVEDAEPFALPQTRPQPPAEPPPAHAAAGAGGNERDAGTRVGEREPAPTEPVSVWPTGPGAGKGAWKPALLEALWTGIVNDREVMQSKKPGLNAERFRMFIHDAPLMEHWVTLLLWFIDAGLVTLDEPTNAAAWNQLADVRCTDLTEIANRLRQTPLPAQDRIDTARRALKRK